MFEGKDNREIHTWVEGRLSAYLDNQLSSLERAQVDRHLRECGQCQRAFDSLSWTVSLLKQAPAPALPRSFTLPVPKPSTRAPIIGLSALRLATALATLVFVALVGVDLILQFAGAPMTASAPSAREAMPATVATSQPTLSIAQVQPTPTPVPPSPTTRPQTEAADAMTLPQGAQATAAPPPAALPPQPLPTRAPAATSAPVPAAKNSPTVGAPRLFAQPGQPTKTAPLTKTPKPIYGRGGGGPDAPETGFPKAGALESTLATPGPSPSPTVQAVPSPTAQAIPSPSPLPTVTVPPAPPTTQPTPAALANVQPTPGPVETFRAAEPADEFLTPLRIGQLAALFLAAFLAALVLLLRRR